MLTADVLRATIERYKAVFTAVAAEVLPLSQFRADSQATKLDQALEAYFKRQEK